MPEHKKCDCDEGSCGCKKSRLDMLFSFFCDSYEEIGEEEMVSEVLVSLLLARAALLENKKGESEDGK